MMGLEICCQKWVLLLLRNFYSRLSRSAFVGGLMNSSFAPPSDAQVSAATVAYRRYMDECLVTFRRYVDESTAVYHKFMAESAAAYQKYVAHPSVVRSDAQRAAGAAAESAAAYQKYVVASDSGFPARDHAPPVVRKVRSWSPAVVTKPPVALAATTSAAKSAATLADPAYGPPDPQYGAAVSETVVAEASGPRHASRSKTTGRGLRNFLNRLLGGN
jgi:hypothetical protein